VIRGAGIAGIWRPDELTGSPVRYTTFSKHIAQLADAVNLQDLLDQLADFLLQSGFAGGAGERLWAMPASRAATARSTPSAKRSSKP